MEVIDIAVDGRVFEGGAGGMAAFTLNVIRRIPEIKFWVLHQNKIDMELPRNCIKISMQKASKWKTDQLIFPKALKRLGNPIYWEPANMGVPVFTKSKVLLTVHDVIPIYMNEYFEESKFPIISKLLYRVRIQIGLWRANKITTDSPLSKNDLQRYFWVNKKKIEIVPLGVSLSDQPKSKKEEDEILRKYGLKRKEYILNHGGMDRRKNLHRLIQSYNKIKTNFRLVIAGEETGIRTNLKSLVADLQLKESITFTGKVPYDEMQVLVRNAKCVVYPTLAEGFGLPLLEAMVAGVPVVGSNIQVLKWIGRDVPFYCDPKSVGSIGKAIKLSLGKTNKNRIMDGIKRAGDFGWEKTGLEIGKLIELAVY